MKPKNKKRPKKKQEEYNTIFLKTFLGFILCCTILGITVISTNVGITFHNIDLVYNANRWCATNNEIYLQNNLPFRCHPDDLSDTYDINKTKPLSDFYISSSNAIFENHAYTFILSLLIGILITILIIMPNKWE